MRAGSSKGRGGPRASSAAARPRGALYRGLAWFEDLLFPFDAGPSSNSTGRLKGWPPEPYALVWAAALAGFFAVLLERVATANPVPPGGDPGEWLTSSYPFVGLPYPSWIIPGQYPPLLFPLLGALVRIGNGPIVGGYLYLAVISVLVGLSTYFLARSLVRSPLLAILAEGFILFNPSFMQLFFFGAYPNLLGLVFMNLALAFAIRFVRSRRPIHAFLFWLSFASAVLTHSLVAAVLVASLAVLAVFLIWAGRLPRGIYRSRWGIAGILVFVGGVGGFYLATRLLGIPHPNYFQTSAFAYVKNGLGQIFYLLLNPYFPGVRPSVAQALPLLVLITGLLVILLVGLRLFWPERLTLSTLAVVSMTVGVTMLCVVGWELSIVTDYVRLGYFLIAPAILGLIVFMDWLITRIQVRALRQVIREHQGEPKPPASTAQQPGAVSTAPAPASARVSAQARWRRAMDSHPGVAGPVFVTTLLVVALLVLVSVYSVPDFSRDEQNNTQTGHDSFYLDAIQSIRSSGIRGTILTVPGAAKWTRALLAENAYSPILPARYTFDPSHISVEELAYFAMTDRYAVTNGNVAFSSLGVNTTVSASSPTYQAAFFGVYDPVVSLPGDTMSIQLVGSSPVNLTMAPTIYAPLQNNPDAMSMVYQGAGFVVNATMTVAPGTTRAVMSIQAIATGSANVERMNVTVANPANSSTHFGFPSLPSELVMIPSGDGGALTTFANVTPASAVPPLRSAKYVHYKAGASVLLQVPSLTGKALAAGSRELGLSIAFDSPGSSNFIYSLPGVISTPSWWSTWNVRWILYINQLNTTLITPNFLWNEPQYLEVEFGAKVYATFGPWQVLLVPPQIAAQNVGSPPGGQAVQ